MQAMGFAAMGMSQMMILILAAGGVGLPLGMPPEKEDPNLAFVAPQDCLLYATWSGMGKADPASTNHTEQLLAEPEVARFAKALEDSLAKATEQLGQSEDPRIKEAAAMVPIWSRAILTRPTAIFVTRLAPSESSVEIEAGLIVKADANAARLAQSLAGLLAAGDREEARLKEVTLGGKKFYQLAADPQALPVPMVFGSDGDYFFLSLGQGVIEQMQKRIAAREVPAWLTKLQADLPVERRASLSYVNVKALRDTLLPLAGPQGEQVAAALGLSQIQTLQTVTGLDADGIVSKSLLTIDGQSRGILTLLDGPGIKPAHLTHIPSDALFASVLSLDAAKAFDTTDGLVRELGGPFAAQEWDQALGDMEEQTGVKLKDDVLASLGSTWTLSMSAADGWYTGIVATVEVKDRARLAAVQEKLIALAKQQAEQFGPESVEIKTTEDGDRQIHYLSIGGGFLPVQPAWCLTDKQLVVALFPQTVRSILDRPKSDKSLADAPPLAAALEGEGNIVAVTYHDSQRMFESSYPALQMFLPMMQAGMNEGFREFSSGPPPQIFDAAMLPTARSIHRHLQPGVTVVRRTSRGLETTTRQTLPTTNIGATAPVAVALLLPAVQAARESARRMQSQNNLKQVALSMHIHHDTWRGLPAAYSLTKEGKPGLSWRVHLLPYLEQQVLYEQFHLDEPWDSEHNKKLIAKMPPTYRSPNSRAEEGKTTYLAVVGKNAIIVPPADSDKGKEHPIGSTFASVVDGLSNTIMVVETTDELAVIWTRPGDFEVDDKDPFKGLVNAASRGFHAALGDGSVQFLKKDWDPKMLKRALQRNDGEEVEFPE